VRDFEPPHEPRADDPYFKRWIARHGIAAWENLSRLPRTLPMQAHEILRDLVANACMSQNEASINLGRWGLSQMPRDWVIAQLPGALDEVLAEGDEWEHRRALELARLLDDEGLLRQVLERCAESSDPKIRALVTDWA
jgi:hypothetical protein